MGTEHFWSQEYLNKNVQVRNIEIYNAQEIQLYLCAVFHLFLHLFIFHYCIKREKGLYVRSSDVKKLYESMTKAGKEYVKVLLCLSFIIDNQRHGLETRAKTT